MTVRTHIFRDYLQEIKKFRKTVFAFSLFIWGPGGVFDLKKMSKISLSVRLTTDGTIGTSYCFLSKYIHHNHKS